jgi:Fur family peroxide stress response transcriptional regulator
MATRTDAALLESFRRVCRVHGLKVTPQRVMIYEELMGSGDHPTLEVLHERVRRRAPNVSFDTVYRTVARFRDLGLTRMVDGFGASMRFDPRTDRHHHFRCVRCQAIIDFTDPQYDALDVPQQIRRRCEITNVRVTVEGLCEECRRSRSPKAQDKTR